MNTGPHPDDVDPDDYTPEYFNNLITQIDDHPDWEFRPSENQPRDELAERASEFQQDEMFVYHSETDAIFYMTMPHAFEPVMAVTGGMNQPLDGTQKRDPYEGSFGEQIMEAYQSTVEGHDAEYLDIDPDPVQILGISVPLDYDEDALDESLSVAGDVSREIQKLNDEVVSVLEEHS